jgi:hypothetical protein
MTAAASTTHRPTTVIRSALARTLAWLSRITSAYWGWGSSATLRRMSRTFL